MAASRTRHIDAGNLLGDKRMKRQSFTNREEGRLPRLLVLRWLHACLAIFCLLGASGVAHAQAGIGQSAPTGPVGSIGSDKAGGGITQCPAGQFVTGMRHVDRANLAPNGSFGMTVQADLYCSTITTDGTTITITSGNTVTGFVYDQQGTVRTGNCPAGQVAASFYGRDRDTSGFAWTSQVGIGCRTVVLAAGDWVQFDTSTINRIDIGVIEGNAPHTSRGPFCGGANASQGMFGYARQGGGEGYDGMNAYCATFVQARHSSVLTFTDFAWSQTLGGSGWLTNLTLGGTTLTGGAGKTPYAAVGDNVTTNFQINELYVQPNSNYGAVIVQRPAGIPTNSYVTTGNCLTGIALTNQQDASCALAVEGLPDIAVGITTPTPAYTAYGQQQNVTISATNMGPGATDGDDGFTLVATLPAGWTAVSAPANCTLSGGNTVVTCALNPTPLAGSASPGASGGSVDFTFPVTVSSPTAAGSYTANVALGRGVPDGDGDPTNDDYNTANDASSGPLALQFGLPALGLTKIWANAVPNDSVTLSTTGGGLNNPSLVSTAGSANETDAGALEQVQVGDVITLSEVFGGGNVGSYDASAWSCTGGQLTGTTLTIRPEDALEAIVCTITNTRQETDLQIVKTSIAPTVRSGEVISYTITATNNGPNTGNGAVIRDIPDAALDCTIPVPVVDCTGSGGAVCPSPTVPVTTLTGTGVTIPTFPVGGQIVMTLQCRVNATGLP